MANADQSRPLAAAALALERFPSVKPTWSLANKGKIVGFDTRDIRARPFNLLRTRVAKTIEAHGAHVVGVTSPTPAAGKSFLSLNLAASLARLGEQPVYLVDFDLRRASVAEQLGIKVERGINDFLTGDSQRLEDVGLRIEGHPLVVFPTRLVSSNSAEYLTGEHFSRLLQLLRREGEGAIVIFDLPPVFANDDAMLSVQALDGYFMIVDSGKTTRRQLVDAIDMLQPAPCLGSILNRYKGGVLDSYGYSSKLYDGYYKA